MRKNVSLTQPIEDRAEEIIKARGFTGLSDMIATLVREEYERRHPPQVADALQETPPPYGANLTAAETKIVDVVKKEVDKLKGKKSKSP